MKRIERLLWMIVALELIGVAVVFGRQLMQPMPPLPDLQFVDKLATEEIVALRNQLSPQDAQDWLELSNVYMAFGFYRDADGCYQRAAELDPTSFEIAYRWGIGLARLGRTADSTMQFRRALQWAEKDQAIQCWYRIGRNYLREENADQAEIAFQKVSDFAPAAHELFKLLIRSGRGDETKPMLAVIEKQYPNAFSVHRLHAEFAESIGDTRAAADWWDRSNRAPILLEDDDSFAFLNSVRNRFGANRLYVEFGGLLRSNRYPEAVQKFREALDVEWHNGVVGTGATIIMGLNEPDEAIELIEEFIVRSNPSSNAMEILGDAYYIKGDEEMALGYWKRSMTIHHSKGGHRRLAYYYDRHGNQEKAQSHRAMNLHFRGVEAFRNHDPNKALSLLNEAVELAPQHAHSWFYVGEVHRQLEASEDAKGAYERCVSINPYHGRAKVALERITE